MRHVRSIDVRLLRIRSIKVWTAYRCATRRIGLALYVRTAQIGLTAAPGRRLKVALRRRSGGTLRCCHGSTLRRTAAIHIWRTCRGTATRRCLEVALRRSPLWRGNWSALGRRTATIDVRSTGWWAAAAVYIRRRRLSTATATIRIGSCCWRTALAPPARVATPSATTAASIAATIPVVVSTSTASTVLSEDRDARECHSKRQGKS